MDVILIRRITMPQCVNGNWKHTDLLVGKGSLYTNMLETSDRARVRATIINEGERSRLKLYHKTLEKHQRVEDVRRERVLANTRRRVQELDAYQSVLEHRFKADQFQCLQFGFKPKRDANTPVSFRRWQLETRILHCGFSKDTLRPEVKKTLDALKPDKRRQAVREQLLNEARGRSNFMIDRNLTNRAKRRSLAAAQGISLPPLSTVPSVEPQERGDTFMTEGNVDI